MTEKLQIIQLLIDTESPSVLTKVKALLLQQSASQADDDYEVPQEVRDKIDKKREDRIAGKTKWKPWKELKQVLANKYGQ